jgi:hypothetical protein
MGVRRKHTILLREYNKVALKDLEIIYDGSEEDFAVTTESAFFKLDNVTITKSGDASKKQSDSLA